METFLTGAANATSFLVLLLTTTTLFRAALRVFRGNLVCAYGVIACAAVGFAYFLSGQSIAASLRLFLSGALAIYWIWTAATFATDRSRWARAVRSDSYEAYLNYLGRPKRAFHRSEAARRLTRRFKERLLVLSSLRAGADLPAAPLAMALGERILAVNGRRKVRLALRLDQDFGDLQTAVETEFARRDLIEKHLEEWKARLLELERAPGETIEDESLDHARAQVRLYEEAKAFFHPLIGPRNELTAATQARLKGRFGRLLKRALGLAFPPELLAISVAPRRRRFWQRAPDFILDIRARPAACRIGYWKQRIDPVKGVYTLIQFDMKWDVALFGRDKEPVTGFELTVPQKVETNPLGVDHSYGYLIVRAYADFAWQLFRAMGFARAPSFDDLPEGDEDQKVATVAQGMSEQFQSDLEVMADNQGSDVFLEGAQQFARHHEAALREIAREIEMSWAGEMEGFFKEGLSGLTNLPLSLDFSDGGSGG